METIEQKTQIVPCLAGKSSMVIWGEGNISACEMLPSFGNIKNKSIKDLMISDEYKKQIKSIKNKECHCTHNCSLITSCNSSLVAFMLNDISA